MLVPAHLLALAACLSVAALAAAQNRNSSGFGGTYVFFECDTQTGNTGHLGVCCDPADGAIFVSARAAPTTARPHVIYHFDARGTLVGSMPQPAIHDASPWGMRDLEFDGQSILGGSESGVSVIDRQGNLATHILANNGPQAVVQPIVLPGVPVIRALALDKAGNGGNGSLLTADFQSAIIEFDFAGNVLNSWPANGWSAFGLAVDPVTGNLWVNSAPNAGEIAELDRNTMTLTGVRFPMALPGLPGVVGQGGLSPASPVAGQHEPWSTVFSLVQLVQAQPDVVAVNRVHLLPGRMGWEEPTLGLAVNSGPFGPGPVSFGPGDLLGFRVTDPLGTRNGQPCWTVINFYLDTRIDAYTDLSVLLPGLGLMVEHRALNPISVPSTPTFVLAPMAVGQVFQARLPAAFPVLTQDTLRVQSIYLEPLLGGLFASTNEALFVGR